MYISELEADHEGSKIPMTDFWLIGSYVVEKVLSKNNYLVGKVATNKTQVLHRIKLQSYTPRQPFADLHTTSQEWKPDTEVISKSDDLYAGAWEYEKEKPIFDNNQNKHDIPSSPEMTV